MSSSTPSCASCGRIREDGEFLAVTEVATGRKFVVCRPSISLHCLARAGTTEVATLGLYDPAAAREFDRQAGGPHADNERADAARRQASASGALRARCESSEAMPTGGDRVGRAPDPIRDLWPVAKIE